jgi:adenosylhomocysteine nucleosidase
MLNQLWAVYKSANTVGIVVALDREREACENGFTTAGALVEEPDEKGSVQINHENYRAVIVVGKGLLDVQEATKTLLNHHRPRWVMMVGIAGSLGRKAARGFQGPKKGDVVVSTSTAVWEIRVKIREEGRSVSVPWDGGEWDILPADPTMFRVAHAVRTELKEIPVHEGLIVTANGIRDQPAEKARILEKWPGGLAVEEEGFVVAFESARRGVPHIVVRGISDLAGGDKIAQQERGNEKKDQEQAAKAAARFAVLVTEALSWRW